MTNEDNKKKTYDAKSGRVILAAAELIKFLCPYDRESKASDCWIELDSAINDLKENLKDTNQLRYREHFKYWLKSHTELK